MNYTDNYELKKLELSDAPPDITELNSNWETIDSELKSCVRTVNNTPVDSSGNVAVQQLSLADIANMVYPVGAIYISAVSTSPATLFGVGTWVRIGEGRTLIDAGANYSAGSTGGSADAVVPYHTHTFTGTAASHTHTFTGSAVTSGNQSASHTHNFSGTTASAGAHTHTRGTMNIVGTHGGICSTGFEPTGAFYNAGERAGAENKGTDPIVGFDASRSGAWTGATSSNGAHTHAFSGTTGNQSGNHTHSVTAKGSNSSTSLTPAGSNSYAGTSGNAAGANMPPYLATYIWRRTA